MMIWDEWKLSDRQIIQMKKLDKYLDKLVRQMMRLDKRKMFGTC